ncbi:MAG: restriction endonuclease subunit S [Paludibacteraceae bacterium]|nr:restriction endonuclease subunit S [Paludibacteraceae bacterium]
MSTYRLRDFVDPIAITVQDPANSGFERFVGLEHYDSNELVIKRFSGVELLTTNAKAFQKNDLLIARRNVYLRRAGVVYFDGITSGDSIVLRVKENCEKQTGINRELAQRILPLVLNTDKFWIYANKHADGMNSKRISKDTLLDYEFDLPSIEEQKVLADKLWAAYKVKESYRQLLSTTDEMLKAKFQEMFRTKETWQSMKLKDIVDPNCPISYGIVQPGEELEEGVPIVRPVDLNSELYVYRRGLKNTSETISNSYKRTILRGDELLMCVRGTTGVMGIATEELKGCNVTRGITPLFFKEGINRFYVLCVFLSDEIQQFIKDHTIGSTLKGINMSIVRDIDVPIATKEIQDEFERVFTQAEATKASLRSSIEAIDRVIRSLINQ